MSRGIDDNGVCDVRGLIECLGSSEFMDECVRFQDGVDLAVKRYPTTQ